MPVYDPGRKVSGPARVNAGAVTQEGQAPMQFQSYERPTKCEGCSACAYCGGLLSKRHEHDHFPVPFACGGEETIPVCLNCHDLKDRVPFSKWSPEAVKEVFTDMDPMTTILLAKAVSYAYRERRTCRELTARVAELEGELRAVRAGGAPVGRHEAVIDDA